jgi:ABC-2 type transport system permease protein
VFSFLVQLGILVAATIVVGRFPTGTRWFYFPLALTVILVFATALALLLSAVNVYLRDVGYLVEVALMILFWGSPIVYSWTLAHTQLIKYPALEQLYLLNPVTLVVVGFQQTFWVAGDGQPSQVTGLGERLSIALVVGVLLLWVCQRTFARLQANFAQEL